MRFRKDARLDTSQVDDLRGQGPTGGMGGGRLAIGGGGLGVTGIIIYLLINAFLGGGLGGELGNLQGVTVANNAPASQVLGSECKTGADANERQDCRIVAVVDSVQKFWQGVFAAADRTYTRSTTVFFTGSTNTGCGAATTDVGPFYCPADKRVYIDLGFFDQLQSQFGAQGGPFAQAYVIAHEYGHHIQDLLGALGGSNQSGAQGRSVRTELQADCYAGVWANHATETGFIEDLTRADIADALDAASAVGDDRIQQKTQGRIDPERWTHGSSAQRQHWFGVGNSTGRVASCNTFSGSI